MASDHRHRPRVRKSKPFASLKPPEENTGLDPGRGRERRSLDLAVQPHERPITALSHVIEYIRSDI